MAGFDPYIAAERAREAYRKTIAQFELLALDAETRECVSARAEKTDTETGVFRERSKNVFDGGLDSIRGVDSRSPISHQREVWAMSEQTCLDVFVEWAEARLDEMAANAKVLESSLENLDANARARAEQAIARVNQWIAEGQAEITNVQAKGEASIAEAKAHIEEAWSQFQNESDTWVERAKDEQAAFRARAQAQAQAWQNAVNTYMRLAAEVHAQNKAQAEAQVEQLKADAQKAQADLNAKVNDLGRAGQASWAAMSRALDESRNVFSRAIVATAEKFSDAIKR
jgi:hypothetical protein